jgi:hypothetical protein
MPGRCAQARPVQDYEKKKERSRFQAAGLAG